MEGCRKAPCYKSSQSCMRSYLHVLIHLFIWALPGTEICEHAGIPCLFVRQPKNLLARGTELIAPQRHSTSQLSWRSWKQFCRSEQTITRNILLQLFCHAEEHSLQNIFLVDNVTVTAIHPALIYYIAVVNRKCKEQNCSAADELLYNVLEAELVTLLLYIHLSLNLFLELCACSREQRCENSYELQLSARRVKDASPWHHNQLYCKSASALVKAN